MHVFILYTIYTSTQLFCLSNSNHYNVDYKENMIIIPEFSTFLKKGFVTLIILYLPNRKHVWNVVWSEMAISWQVSSPFLLTSIARTQSVEALWEPNCIFCWSNGGPMPSAAEQPFSDYCDPYPSTTTFGKPSKMSSSSSCSGCHFELV